MKDDGLYLAYIRECIARIERYTAGGKGEFCSDTKTQDAVFRNLHTLSESTQRLSESLKERYPDVPWRSIAAFRNVVVHGYLGISLAQAWAIVEQDLPRLRDQVERILRDQPVE